MNNTVNTILVVSNTYPVKEQLKQLGATWSPNERGWRVPADKESEARAIMDNAPAPTRRTGSRSNGYRPGRRCYCAECGEPYRRGQHCWENGGFCIPSWE